MQQESHWMKKLRFRKGKLLVQVHKELVDIADNLDIRGAPPSLVWWH